MSKHMKDPLHTGSCEDSGGNPGEAEEVGSIAGIKCGATCCSPCPGGPDAI